MLPAFVVKAFAYGGQPCTSVYNLLARDAVALVSQLDLRQPRYLCKCVPESEANLRSNFDDQLGIRQRIVRIVFSAPVQFRTQSAKTAGPSRDIFVYDNPDYPETGTFVLVRGQYKGWGDAYLAYELARAHPFALGSCRAGA